MTVRDYEAFRDKYRNMPRKKALSEDTLNKQLNFKSSNTEVIINNNIKKLV